MTKQFTKVKTQNPYGKETVTYRDTEAKVTVELQYPLTGDYWWVKLTSKYGTGNDGAFNLTQAQCESLAAIFKAISKENLKVKQAQSQPKQPAKRAAKQQRMAAYMQALHEWSDARTVEIAEFSDIHKRLSDGYTEIDIWPTTGKYYVRQTNYSEQAQDRVVERGGERGALPPAERLQDWLDKLFFAVYK